jgi:AraC family ethanolamine operon transcriptional activator
MEHNENSPIRSRPYPAAEIVLAEPNDINRFSPWEIDFRQIEPRAMEAGVSIRSGNAVTFIQVSMSCDVHQTGTSSGGMLSVGVIRQREVNTWQGVDTSTAELLSFGCADPFDGVSNAGFCGTAISINEWYAEDLADNLSVPIPDPNVCQAGNRRYQTAFWTCPVLIPHPVLV